MVYAVRTCNEPLWVVKIYFVLFSMFGQNALFFAGGGSVNIPSWRYCAAHDASFCTNWWYSAIIDGYIVDAWEDESSAITRMPIYLVETQRDCKEKWQPFPIDSSQNKAAAEFMGHSCFASAKLAFLVAHKYHQKNYNFSPELMLSVWEKKRAMSLAGKKTRTCHNVYFGEAISKSFPLQAIYFVFLFRLAGEWSLKRRLLCKILCFYDNPVFQLHWLEETLSFGIFTNCCPWEECPCDWLFSGSTTQWSDFHLATPDAE